MICTLDIHWLAYAVNCKSTFVLTLDLIYVNPWYNNEPMGYDLHITCQCYLENGKIYRSYTLHRHFEENCQVLIC